MPGMEDPWLPTRHSLLSRLRQWDDDTSWREFFDLYWKLIYGVCLRLELKEDEACEVVQDIFVTLSRTLPEFQYDRRRGAFKTWLYQVIRNKVRDFVKKKHRLERHYVHDCGSEDEKDRLGGVNKLTYQ